MRTGLPSPRTNVNPSYNIGEGYYGAMLGKIDEFRIWSRSLTATEISANYNKPVSAASIGLEGYWPMSSTDGNVINDISCNNHDFALTPAEKSWASASSVVTDNTIIEKIDHNIVPAHLLTTNYSYNSLNQVVKQSTPDGGISEFWYDRLGRLTISQNAEQKQPAVINVENPANRFSYTRYDPIGRIYEVGEKQGASNITETDIRDNLVLENWLNSGANRQVTVTAYDEAPSWAPSSLLGLQHNLRKRVAATALIATGGFPLNPAANRLAASYYSYDIAGNVSRQVQENVALTAIESQYISGNEGLKDLKYEYDLVSGKVNKVLYQDGKWDQFYYSYLYDADNRVVSAHSSRNNYADVNLWTMEATYRYYLHGPLARMELGKNKVQGVDYAYTLQGWLKGVNSQSPDADKDMSGDGKQGSPFQNNGRDVLGFSLGYYNGDYTPIGGTNAPAFGMQYQQPVYDMSGIVRSMESGKGLFNGNISHSTYFIKPIDNGNTRGYSYRYDQLNRLTTSNAHTITVNR